MAIDLDISTHLNIRIDPKVRYLTELAALKSKMSLTEYIEAALTESFSRVTLREASEPQPIYEDNAGKFHIAPIDEEQERIENEAMLISNVGDKVWSENPMTRLEIRAQTLPHLMEPDDTRLWEYIHSRDDLKIKQGKSYKFNRELIAANWKTIKADSAKPQKAGKRSVK